MTRSVDQADHLSFYSLSKLIQWIERSEYKGYDIYDGLNSPILDRVSNKYLRIAALQLNKFSPINFRPLLKIRKDFSPKGMALFLQAYSLLAQNRCLSDIRPNVLKGIDMSFRWLKENAIKKGNGLCWAINFPVTS